MLFFLFHHYLFFEKILHMLHKQFYIKREALRKSEVKPFAVVKDQLIQFLKSEKEQTLIKNYIEGLEPIQLFFIVIMKVRLCL